MQTGLDHFGGFQVIAINGDGFRHYATLLVGRSVHVHLESGYKHHTRHLLLFQAKESSVIFRCRVFREDHGSLFVCALHYQRFSVPGNDHPFDFGLVRAKNGYRRQKKHCYLSYYNRFSVHKFLSFSKFLNSEQNVAPWFSSKRASLPQTWPWIGSAEERRSDAGFFISDNTSAQTEISS
jgi:hypothetical protein